jgi:hypothetical protein
MRVSSFSTVCPLMADSTHSHFLGSLAWRSVVICVCVIVSVVVGGFKGSFDFLRTRLATLSGRKCWIVGCLTDGHGPVKAGCVVH